MTYDELKQAVFAYLGHYPDPDPAFEAMIDTITEQAEAIIYTAVRHPQMVIRTYVLDLASDGATAPFLVPDDLLEIASVVGQDGTWESVTQDQLLDAIRDCTTPPTWWSMVGKELVFSTDPDSTLVLTYYAKPTPLHEGGYQPLFELFPQLFVSAGCVEAARFLREPNDVFVRFQQDFMSRLAEVNTVAWSATIPRRQPLKQRGTH